MQKSGVATFFITLQFSSIIFTFSDLQSSVSHARFSSTFSSKSCTKTSYYWHTSDPFWYGSLQKILTAFLKQLYKSFPILYAPCGSRVKHLPIVQNLNISLNFCARLDFNIIWFVKCMKIRPIIVNYLFIVTHPHRKNLPQNAA